MHCLYHALPVPHGSSYMKVLSDPPGHGCTGAGVINSVCGERRSEVVCSQKIMF